MSDFLERVFTGVATYRNLRGERADFWPAFDAGLSAMEQKAREQAEQREWQERQAASEAEIRASCARLGWWWPPR